jgi:hypothetical protein
MPTHHETDIFGTVASKDYLAYQKEGDYKKVIDFLNFNQKDISMASGVSKASVRFDVKIPSAVKERIEEWANIINLVAGHFNGDLEKTHLWFVTSNPLLGDIAPRDMIRIGRYQKLFKFIVNSIQAHKVR